MVIFIIVILGIYIWIKHTPGTTASTSKKAAPVSLPPSFTLNLTKDDSSSGGTRSYVGTIVFANDALAKASEKYIGLPGSGKSQRFEYDCIAINGAWVGTTTPACKVPVAPPLTKDGVMEAIKSGAMKPAASCVHGDLCYAVSS